uniref:Uncharacterized protein n=1 Tax=Plectus sambesii TaxID=2011161 RepID=A0A914XK44_9BILA
MEVAPVERKAPGGLSSPGARPRASDKTTQNAHYSRLSRAKRITFRRCAAQRRSAPSFSRGLRGLCAGREMPECSRGLARIGPSVTGRQQRAGRSDRAVVGPEPITST